MDRRQKHIRFDWAVKKMLRSKANFGILEGFLCELLKEDIKILELLESESNKETADDKYNRVDILVKDSNDRLIIVEIQNTREIDYFYKILYNTSKTTSENIKQGGSYRDVKKVITVSVVYFNLGQGKDYVYHGSTTFVGLHNKDTLTLTKKQQQIFNADSVTAIFPDHFIIKVNEFNDNAKDSLDEWVYFLKNSEIKDEFTAKGLDEAREKLKAINLTEEELPAYRHYLEQLRYEASIAETFRFDLEYAVAEGTAKGMRKGMKNGMKKGMEKGMEKGAKQKAKDSAVRMLKDNIPIESISKYTGLTKNEIEELL
ncbi:MAG: Rpn family recombination-promoting nuclease/putative transposase [bacterium]|nr:Rpn family recombination-promoting nuclease/putative transposase [bacterium]